MNPDRGDTVVRIHAFQRRFFQQHKICNFPWLDGSNLRVELEFAGVTDRRCPENLRERQPCLLKLLHLQVPIQTGKISVGWARWRIRAEKKVGVFAGQI